jgi:hypothetical protein
MSSANRVANALNALFVLNTVASCVHFAHVAKPTIAGAQLA